MTQQQRNSVTGSDVKQNAANKLEPKRDASFRTLLSRVHDDEQGGVSIETVLILAAIALPVLIFIIKFGWPRIKEFFNEGLDSLEGNAENAENDGF